MKKKDGTFVNATPTILRKGYKKYAKHSFYNKLY